MAVVWAFFTRALWASAMVSGPLTHLVLRFLRVLLQVWALRRLLACLTEEVEARREAVLLAVEVVLLVRFAVVFRFSLAVFAVFVLVFVSLLLFFAVFVLVFFFTVLACAFCTFEARVCSDACANGANASDEVINKAQSVRAIFVLRATEHSPA